MRPYLISLALVVALTFALRAAGDFVNSVSAALLLLLSVLVSSQRFGSKPGAAAAVAAMLSLNYFFLPPIGTLDIADPVNWAALGVFLAVALTVGELSARVQRRAREAEQSTLESKRLYRELQEAFHRQAEAEALKRSDQLKTALVDAVTHELRTPITSIKASTTALLRDGDGIHPDTRRELLEIVDQETDRLNGLVEDLVGAARVASESMTLNRSWIAPEDVIADAVARATPRLRGHRIEIDVPPTMPSIFADARAISEVVFQLLENAAKYAPEQTAIRVSAGVDADETVEIRVDDEGPGVPLAERARIFEKFYRVADTSAQASGLGMGLAITRGLVEAHGGRISVGDRPGRTGARFTVRIPIGDTEEPSSSGGAA